MRVCVDSAGWLRLWLWAALDRDGFAWRGELRWRWLNEYCARNVVAAQNVVLCGLCVCAAILWARTRLECACVCVWIGSLARVCWMDGWMVAACARLRWMVLCERDRARSFSLPPPPPLLGGWSGIDGNFMGVCIGVCVSMCWLCMCAIVCRAERRVTMLYGCILCYQPVACVYEYREHISYSVWVVENCVCASGHVGGLCSASERGGGATNRSCCTYRREAIVACIRGLHTDLAHTHIQTQCAMYITNHVCAERFLQKRSGSMDLDGAFRCWSAADRNMVFDS